MQLGRGKYPGYAEEVRERLEGDIKASSPGQTDIPVSHFHC